jgi:hypothetical protein
LKLLTRITIPGNPGTKANSRQIVSRQNANGERIPSIAKSDTALAYARAARFHLRDADLPRHDGPVLVIATMFYSSRRPDLTFDLVQDILQTEIKKAYGIEQVIFPGAWENDRQVFVLLMRKKLDPDNPRAEISIYALPTANKHGDPGGRWMETDHDTWAAALVASLDSARDGASPELASTSFEVLLY